MGREGLSDYINNKRLEAWQKEAAKVIEELHAADETEKKMSVRVPVEDYDRAVISEVKGTEVVRRKTEQEVEFERARQRAKDLADKHPPKNYNLKGYSFAVPTGEFQGAVFPTRESKAFEIPVSEIDNTLDGLNRIDEVLRNKFAEEKRRKR